MHTIARSTIPRHSTASSNCVNFVHLCIALRCHTTCILFPLLTILTAIFPSVTILRYHERTLLTLVCSQFNVVHYNRESILNQEHFSTASLWTLMAIICCYEHWSCTRTIFQSVREERADAQGKRASICMIMYLYTPVTQCSPSSRHDALSKLWSHRWLELQFYVQIIFQILYHKITHLIFNPLDLPELAFVAVFL